MNKKASKRKQEMEDMKLWCVSTRILQKNFEQSLVSIFQDPYEENVKQRWGSSHLKQNSPKEGEPKFLH